MTTNSHCAWTNEGGHITIPEWLVAETGVGSQEHLRRKIALEKDY